MSHSQTFEFELVPLFLNDLRNEGPLRAEEN